MIFNGTILNVCDNTGVKWVQCLKILGKKPKAFGEIRRYYSCIYKKN